MASHSKLGKNMEKKNISQVIQNDHFHPLVGGHLTFGRMTFHSQKITKNCQVRRLNTWLWPLYTFQPAVSDPNKLLGGSSDWNGPQKPQANVLGKNQIRPTNPNASQRKFVWLFRMTLLLFKTPRNTAPTNLSQGFSSLLQHFSETLFPKTFFKTLYNTSPQLTTTLLQPAILLFNSTTLFSSTSVQLFPTLLLQRPSPKLATTLFSFSTNTRR